MVAVSDASTSIIWRVALEEISRIPVKFIRIDFCQPENALERTGLQFVMVGNDRADFAIRGHL